jgi:hypothetical protein
MPAILQEKYQVDYPQQRNDDARSGWVSDQSARVKKGTPGVEHHAGMDPSQNRLGRLSLPPGMDGEDQEFTDQHDFETVMGGQSDVSRDWNAEAVAKGYTRKQMRATDDEYTKAHQDAFYDEINVDGDIGFAERNNMLDRL